jgi:phage anti-repressor protein
MQALIPVVDFQIGEALLPAVNARELHAFLQVGKDFSNWLKDRVAQYKFIENKDFVCSPISASKVQGGHNRKDYMVSLSMAKELAMVERNDKGRQARLYFIACEQRALQLAGAAALPVAVAVPANLPATVASRVATRPASADEAYLATLRFPSAAALGAAMPVILALMQQHGAELAGAEVSALSG